MTWILIFTSQAKKDAKKISHSGFKTEVKRLIEILANDQYHSPPPYEKSVGDLTGTCSRRINIQHRLVFQILDNIKTGKIIRM